jgi:hypothetical protein
LLGVPSYRNVFGKRNVERSCVVISPAAWDWPITVETSPGNDGKSALANALPSTRMKRQQVPSAFRLNWYVPLSSTIVRPVFTEGCSSVCQSFFAE